MPIFGTGVALRGFIFIREAKTNTGFVGLGSVGGCLHAIKRLGTTGVTARVFFR